MGKQVFMSLLICLLIPTCIAVYFFLYKDLQANGMLSFSDEEAVVVNKEVAAESQDVGEEESASEEIQIDVDKPLIEAAEVTPEEDDDDPGDPMDDIDYVALQQEMEKQDQENEDNVRVQVITKDAAGNVIDERYETLDGVKIVQPNSDRHLEIIAVEFARMHFEFTAKNVYFSGKLINRDDEYAKIMVTKTAWSDDRHQEKFIVILEMLNEKPRPISMQQVEE